MMGHCGTLEHKSTCIASPYTGRAADIARTCCTTQREFVSHCLPICILTDRAEQCLVGALLDATCTAHFYLGTSLCGHTGGCSGCIPFHFLVAVLFPDWQSDRGSGHCWFGMCGFSHD